ncbi:MAG TPA: hypothetical protein VGQ46_09445 [Thermoanaerobaculia bacterium]|nr:hypothetical protein [Thermoanaerobaculia bacterium]
MTKLLVTFHSPEPLSVSALKERFALTDTDIDPNFGVVEIDPDAHLYAALVDPGAASRMTGLAPDVKTHSNPIISAFDVPESSGDKDSR